MATLRHPLLPGRLIDTSPRRARTLRAAGWVDTDPGDTPEPSEIPAEEAEPPTTTSQED